MIMLTLIQKECNEANKVAYEEYIVVQRLDVLNGGMGWKINMN